MAAYLKAPTTAVEAHCKEQGLVPKAGTKERIEQIKGMVPEREKINRPPAIYSNVSREQHVAKYLNS
jgi:hypothetical protein